MEEDYQSNGGPDNCGEHMAVKDRLNIILTVMIGIGIMMAYQTLSQTPDIKIALTEGLTITNSKVREIEAKQEAVALQIKGLDDKLGEHDKELAEIRERIAGAAGRKQSW